MHGASRSLRSRGGPRPEPRPTPSPPALAPDALLRELGDRGRFTDLDRLGERLPCWQGSLARLASSPATAGWVEARFFLRGRTYFPRSALPAPGDARETSVERLAEEIARGLPGRARPLRVAVSGGPGSGKSTTAKALARELRARGHRARVLELDGYLRPEAERRTRSGAELFDRAALSRDLRAIAREPDRPIAVRNFDHASGQLVEHGAMVPADEEVLILEGVIADPREADLTIAAVAPDETRLARMLARSPAHRERLELIFWQHQLALVPEVVAPAARRADFIVDTAGTRPADIDRVEPRRAFEKLLGPIGGAVLASIGRGTRAAERGARDQE